MPRQKTSILAAFFLPFVAALLLAVILVTAFILNLPHQVEDMFGPPSPSLSFSARYRLAALLLLQKDDLISPLDPTGVEIPFSVNSGESAPSIIQRLNQSGLIANPAAFRTYLQYSGLDTSLQAGNYRLSPAMSAVEIAQEMQDATPAEVDFAILAGWRIEEIAASLPSSGLSISPEAFLSTSRMGMPYSPLAQSLPDLATLEGLLFPGIYTVSRQINAPDLLALMIANFDRNLTSELRQGYANQSLSLYEAVTLASIIERESVVDEEMPLIASVFLNRYAIGMKLESDPTVQYAVGYHSDQNTWWKNPLTIADLQFESLYNTYLYAGLPPSPIANPGIQALRAVAFPAQTPYFYFRSACDDSGRHAFAETYQEHLDNGCP